MPPSLKALNQRVADAKAAVDKTLAALSTLEAKTDLTEAEASALNDLRARLETELAAAESVVTERDQARERLERDRRVAQISAAIRPGARIFSAEPDPAQTGGFASMADFASAVRAADTGSALDDRLRSMMAAAPTAHIGDGSNDGYLLPPMYREQIWSLVYDVPDISSLVDNEPTTLRSVSLLADETTPWSTGGVQVRWEAEQHQLTASKAPPADPRIIQLHRLYAFVLASEELLEDAPRLATRLIDKAALAIRWTIGDTLIYGDGVGKPLGWFRSPAKITVAKDTGQAAKTLSINNLVAMYTRLLVQPGDQPIWIANRDILPQLLPLTIGNQPVWLPPQGLMAAPEGTILGYPVRWMEYAQTLGAEGDLQLVSPKGYYSPQRSGGVRLDTSIHLYFDRGLQAFRWAFRLGGQPHLSAPVSPAKGGTTRSHFVTLATRA